MTGKKVLLIDSDPQGSLTASLGFPDPDEIPLTLATIMMDIMDEKDFPADYGMLHHKEGVDLIPANMELSGIEVSLANTMSREMILKEYIEMIRDQYDFILIDCMPSLGVMTINALVAADRVLVPVHSSYLSVKGLQMLLKTIAVVKKRLNKQLKNEGILITILMITAAALLAILAQFPWKDALPVFAVSTILFWLPEIAALLLVALSVVQGKIAGEL